MAKQKLKRKLQNKRKCSGEAIRWCWSATNGNILLVSQRRYFRIPDQIPNLQGICKGKKPHFFMQITQNA